MSNNKVKYGLKNVHYAKATIADDGTATYGTVKPWPGAVNMSLDPQGDTTKFRADNINYWIGVSNAGYEGDFESALIPDDFMIDIMGYIRDSNGALIEDVGAQPAHFALMFQFEGDQKARRHVLYNVTATRPSVTGATTEETIEPQTETVTFTSGSVFNSTLQKDISKASVDAGDTPYGNWFDSVYQPGGSPTYTVTQNLTNVTSSYTGATVNAGESLIATLTAEAGYNLNDVTVTMGGVDVTGIVYDDGAVEIASVTGNVVITAAAS